MNTSTVSEASVKAPKTVTGHELRDGMRVYVQGYVFQISNVMVCTSDCSPIQDKQVVRFTGHCTDDARNNSIRHTSYNGGRYGQLASGIYTLAQ